MKTPTNRTAQGRAPDDAERHSHARPEEPGYTARERLGWLLETFIYGDLTAVRIDEESRLKLWFQLVRLIRDATRGRWEVSDAILDWELLNSFTLREAPDPATIRKLRRWSTILARELLKTQRVLRQAVESTGLAPMRRKLGVLGITWYVGMKSRRSRDRLQSTLWYAFDAPVPSAALMALFTLLDEVPRSLIRACAYGQTAVKKPLTNIYKGTIRLVTIGFTGKACGRVFVGTKRQKYCVVHIEQARRDRDRKAQEKYRKHQAERQRQTRARRRRTRSRTRRRSP